MNTKAAEALAKYRAEVKAGLRPKPERKRGLVRRLTVHPLSGFFGSDRNKWVVFTFIAGTDTIPDVIELRPQGTRRAETIAVEDVYRMAIQARVNSGKMAKLRERKEKKAIRLAQQRQERAERKLTL